MLEATGLCQGAWVLAALHKSIAGFKRDEVYIGTAEERRAKKMGDDTGRVRTGPGHALKLPLMPAMAGIEDYSLEEISALEADLKNHMADVEAKLADVKIQKANIAKGGGGKAFYPIGSYGFAENAPESLRLLAEKDPAVMEYIASIRKTDLPGDIDEEAGES
jgi:hypothetical protein